MLISKKGEDYKKSFTSDYYKWVKEVKQSDKDLGFCGELI